MEDKYKENNENKDENKDNTGDNNSANEEYPYDEDMYGEDYSDHPDEEPLDVASQDKKSSGAKRSSEREETASEKSKEEEADTEEEESDNGGDHAKGDKEKSKDPEKRMPFLEHLEELRWTIIRSMIGVILAAIVCYIFSKEIIELLRKPAPEDFKLIFLAPTEGFLIHIKVAMYAGFVMVIPYVAYEFWRFIVPGLFDKEKKLVPPIVFFTVFCFALGASFAYFVIIPFGMKFLLSFQSEALVATITIAKYLGFVVTIILVFGLVFELPVLAYFLSSIGLLTPEFMRSKRPYSIVIIFIMAAVLTPPDVFTQSMLAIPLIILYEISILVSKAVNRKRKEALEA